MDLLKITNTVLKITVISLLLCIPSVISTDFFQTFNCINTEKEKKPIKKELMVMATIYNPVMAQTDSNPLETASGKIIDTTLLKRGKLKWVALSRPLLKVFGGKFRYGDYIHIKNAGKLNGKYMVVDCMPETRKHKIDILVHKDHNNKYTLKKRVKITW